MPSESHPIIFNQVSFAYREAPVLENISIAFEGKAVTAILGKSGSGKSTLLELINGLNVPQSGDVMLFGSKLDYDHIHTLRLQIGYVVQRFGLFPHMTVQENIILPALLKGIPKNDLRQRIRELMNMTQLPESYLSKYPHTLSGGEQQRVSLCRALLLNPPVLLMDEPFASLDYVTRHAVYRYVKEMQKTEPRTVVLVTHDWEEARLLADRFAWIENGKVKDQGGPEDLGRIKEAYLQGI